MTRSILLSVVGFAALTAGAAQAQTPTATAEASTAFGVEEVTVVAQRREESLQDVPIAISAYSEETLKAQAITDSLDLAKLTPSLIINKNIGAAVPWIRGVGSISSGFGTELPVAVYIDGFYLPSPAAGVFSLNNIARVEVLKGPQGTLFGRNASAGVVHVITKEPTTEPEMDAVVGYGNYDTVTGSFYGSTGLSDSLSGSLALTGTKQGEGWGRNVTTGSDIFKTEQWGAHAKLMWAPSDQTKVILSGLYDWRASDVGIQYGIPPGALAPDGTPFLGKYNVSNRNDRVGKANQSQLGLTIEQDLGFATLVSLTGYNRIHSDFSFNQSGYAGSFVPPRSPNETELDGKGTTFTQEIQLLSPKDSRVNWILGAYYLTGEQSLDQVVHGICANATAASCIGPVPIYVAARQDSISYAAFGQASVDFMENFRLTAGLRYTYDEKDVGDSFATPAPGYPNTPAVLPATALARPGQPYPGNPAGIPTSASWDKLTWRLALDYNLTEDVMLYASVNRGFKSGTYNITVFNNPPARPEVLDAYELGVKSTLFDRRLRVNAALYHYDYADIQLRTSAPPAIPGQTILFNAGQSTVDGLDVDVQFAATRELTFNGGFTVLDAKYERLAGGTCVRPAVLGPGVFGGNVSTVCDRSGATMIRAPKFSGAIGFTYTREMSFGQVMISASDTYTSMFYWEPSNRLKQKPYHNVSAAVTWTSPDERYDVQLWGRNLADEFYYTAAFEGAQDTYSPAEPLTYGVRIGVHF